MGKFELFDGTNWGQIIINPNLKGIHNYPASIMLNSLGQVIDISTFTSPPITNLTLSGAIIGAGTGAVATVLNNIQLLNNDLFNIVFVVLFDGFIIVFVIVGICLLITSFLYNLLNNIVLIFVFSGFAT